MMTMVCEHKSPILTEEGWECLACGRVLGHSWKRPPRKRGPHYPSAAELDELRRWKGAKSSSGYMYFAAPTSGNASALDMHPQHLKVWPEERSSGIPHRWDRRP